MVMVKATLVESAREKHRKSEDDSEQGPRREASPHRQMRMLSAREAKASLTTGKDYSCGINLGP